MGIVDPMAMTNSMATGMVDFGAGGALWLMLLGLLVGSAAGILFAGAAPRRPRWFRPSRLVPFGRPAGLARAAK
ncbi:hypothetical protein KF840_17120 [bacterium]|nr:hypothetical protein [bacterium]